MLEPVALHQTGFKVPGLVQDARGIVVGTQAATLLLGIDRLVSLLRLLSEELQIDDVLPSLRIELVRNPLGAQAYLLRLGCADSLLLDRLARAARLCGAVLCIGAGKHFVPYRDRRAPLGYDASELHLPEAGPGATADAGAYVLYSEVAAQPLVRVREVALLQLLSQLALLASPGGAPAALSLVTGALRSSELGDSLPVSSADGALHADPLSSTVPALPEPLWLTAPLGLLPRLARYLWERGAHAELVLPDSLPPPETKPSSAMEQELGLLRLTRIRGAQLQQLLTLPGLRLYNAVGDRLAVELGYAHPLRLAALGSLFAPDRLYLFSGSKRGYTELPIRPLLPIERLIELRHLSPAAAGGPDDAGAPLRPRLIPPADPTVPPVGAPARLRVPLKLVAQPAERGQRLPTATLVPWPRTLWLSRLLYMLPATLLGGLAAVCLDEGVLVLGAHGVHALPLGMLLYEPAAGVFVPLGWELLPRLPGELLAAQLGGTEERILLFLPDQSQPLALPRAQLQPLSQQLLAPTLPTLRPAPSRGEPLDPELQNAPVSALSMFALWPLWGRLGEEGP